MNAIHAKRPSRPPERFIPNPKLKFLEQCREVMRFKQLAGRTEETYLQWIKRFILFHRRHGPGGNWIWQHPRDMGENEVRAFLTDLAARQRVSAATQNQALNALLFLYRQVVGGEMAWVDGFEMAQRSRLALRRAPAKPPACRKIFRTPVRNSCPLHRADGCDSP